MHELSLTQSVVDAIVERMGDAEITGTEITDAKITCVRLEIGKLSGVMVDSIRFCFDLVAEGTIVMGARLEIEEPPGHARCRACATGFDTDDPIVLCPACESAEVDVLSGRDMRIRSVEVSSACAPPAGAPATPASG